MKLKETFAKTRETPPKNVVAGVFLFFIAQFQFSLTLSILSLLISRNNFVFGLAFSIFLIFSVGAIVLSYRIWTKDHIAKNIAVFIMVINSIISIIYIFTSNFIEVLKEQTLQAGAVLFLILSMSAIINFYSDESNDFFDQPVSARENSKDLNND